MVRLILFLAFVQLIVVGCKPAHVPDRNVDGTWCFQLDLGGPMLPFIVQLSSDSSGTTFVVRNGAERIKAEQAELRGDSLFVRMPVFNTEIRAKLLTDSTLQGEFVDLSRSGDYRIALKGSKGNMRFQHGDSAHVDITGRWSVGFSPNTADAYPAIGEFKQRGDSLTGTFLTTTGDFRYLEGTVSGDSMFLSGFDGAHALLFKARVSGDSIAGGFWSGTHWFEQWQGVRNEQSRLPDPEFLTMLRPGSSKFKFAFPDLNGKMVSNTDERFAGKVVIAQLMGSWCPNCLDETAYLIELYRRMGPQGLEIVAIAFERGNTDQERMKNLKRLQDHLSIPYPMLLAGSSSKAEASEKFPMLNNVISFPTTVFIDKRGRVRRIHTGFSGPGTGAHYDEFVARTEDLVTQLIEEKVVF
jgi:thiol-disulfide isomerase/thioredoxin